MQRGHGLIELLIGFLILMVIITFAMRISVNQMQKGNSIPNQRNRAEEMVEETQRLRKQNIEMQKEQLEETENEPEELSEDSEIQQEEISDNNQNDITEEQDIEELEDVQKEQKIQILEEELRNSGDMVELH